VKQSYAYYPGCLASLSQKELDVSTRAIAAKLGLSWSTSPASPAAARATCTRPGRSTTCT